MKIAEGIELDPKAFRKQSGVEERFVRLDEGNFKWAPLDPGEPELELQKGSGYGSNDYHKYKQPPGYVPVVKGDAQKIANIVKANLSGGKFLAPSHQLADDGAEIEVYWKGQDERVDTHKADKILGALVKAGFGGFGPVTLGPYKKDTVLTLYVGWKKP